MLLAAFLLIAQDGQGGAQPGGGGLGPLFSFMPILLIIVFFYLLIIRPGKRQEQERQAMLGALKKNDKVVTSGGLIGTVAVIKENEDEVTLKVDDNSNVRLRVTKSSIVRVLSASSSEAPKE
jgi:preprotein translocase subunit YajC